MEMETRDPRRNMRSTGRALGTLTQGHDTRACVFAATCSACFRQRDDRPVQQQNTRAWRAACSAAWTRGDADETPRASLQCREPAFNATSWPSIGHPSLPWTAQREINRPPALQDWCH
jgi:hypothetical protein